MFGSNFIELGIALSFLFLLLSLMCSMLSEMLSKYLSWRSEMLEESIRQLLRDADISAQFYRHPVIKSLEREVRPLDKERRLEAESGDRFPRTLARWANRKLDLFTMPSYIKSTIFARVVLDILVLMPRLDLMTELKVAIEKSSAFKAGNGKASLLADVKAAEFETAEAFGPKIDAIGSLIAAKVEDKAEREALLDLVKRARAEGAAPPKEGEGTPAAPAPSPSPSRTVAEVRAALGKLKNGETRRIFDSLLSGDGVKDMPSAETRVARYYDDVQERVSGWYKRKSQRWVFAISLLLALILNANTLIIGDKLLRDNTVRALVVATAEGSRDKYKPQDTSAVGAPASTAAGGAAGAAANSGATSAGQPGGSGSAASQPTLQELKQEVEKLSLPLGWPDRPASVATSIYPSAMACLRDLRGAQAGLAGEVSADAKKVEEAANKKLSDAKARLEGAKSELARVSEDLKKAKKGAAEAGGDKSAESLSAAESAVEAAKKGVDVASEAVSTAAAASGAAALLLTQMNAEVARTRAEALKVREDEDKQTAQADKVRAEVDSDPRSCPVYVCGDLVWGAQWPYYLKKSVLWVLTRGVGWLITALAAALGAQFWFDVLSRIMQVRASKKPEEQTNPKAT